jgi:hypothetical protein
VKVAVIFSFDRTTIPIFGGFDLDLSVLCRLFIRYFFSFDQNMSIYSD